MVVLVVVVVEAKSNEGCAGSYVRAFTCIQLQYCPEFTLSRAKLTEFTRHEQSEMKVTVK